MGFTIISQPSLLLTALFLKTVSCQTVEVSNTCQPSYSKDGTKATFTLELPVTANRNQSQTTMASLQQKIQNQEKMLSSQATLIMQQAEKLNKMDEYIQKLSPPEHCRQLLVSGKTPIPDSQITASTSWSNGYRPSNSRIYNLGNNNEGGCWHSKVADTNQWLQFDFGRVRKLTAVLTKGRTDYPYFVREFQVHYGNSTLLMAAFRDEKGMIKAFEGNIDTTEIQQNVLIPPIYARYLRINPTSIHNGICIRADVRGC